MKVVTGLFGYLGKSGSRTNTPEPGDTKIVLPGSIQLVLETPFPIFGLYNAPLPAGNTPVNSFMFFEEILFNLNSGVVMFPLGPGLWDFEFSIYLRPAGAVQDITSTYSIGLLDTQTAVQVVLARLVNDGTKPQSFTHRWRQLITSDQAYSINRSAVIGAGTGTNFGNFVAKCTRLF
jgi:hypothetical protein